MSESPSNNTEEKAELEKYWPNWMDDISTARRLIEHTAPRVALPEDEELLIIMQNQDVLLKGLYWLLREQVRTASTED